MSTQLLTLSSNTAMSSMTINGYNSHHQHSMVKTSVAGCEGQQPPNYLVVTLRSSEAIE